MSNSEKPKLRLVHEGEGETSSSIEKPNLRIVPSLEPLEELALKTEEIKEYFPLSNKELKQKNEEKEALLEMLTYYDVMLLNSQDRLLESGNTNAIRLHAAMTMLVDLNRPNSASFASSAGDIDQYIENHILNVDEDEFGHETARAIIHCSAITMLMHAIECELEEEDNTDGVAAFSKEYPSPTWKSFQENRDEIFRGITGITIRLISLTGFTKNNLNRRSQEALQYFQEMKETIAEVADLDKNEKDPAGELFLQNWQQLIK